MVEHLAEAPAVAADQADAARRHRQRHPAGVGRLRPPLGR
jgi:hypothetical protein